MQFSTCVGGLALSNGADLDSLMASWRTSQNLEPTAATNRRSRPQPQIPESSLWDGTTVLDPSTYRSQKLEMRFPSPNAEICRQEWIQRLRERLGDLVSAQLRARDAESARLDSEIFDKWLYACLSHRDTLPEHLVDKMDPLLSGDAVADADAVLAQDLVRFGVADPSAIVDQLRIQCQRAIRAVMGAGRQSTGSKVRLTVQGDFTHLSSGKHRVKIRNEHYAKLEAMFQIVRDQFLPALFCLLLRYVSLSDTGMQAACNESVFAALRDDFDVRMECFASPLNCFFVGQYCSLFPDLDVCFGSLGSFFRFFPSSGSYQANPPFVDEVIARMAAHMSQVLEAASSPLSFTIVVPHKPVSAAWRSLRQHPLCRHHLLLKQSSHGFCEGAQHRRPTRYKISTCDTSVFFLQNDQGSHSYEVTEPKLARLQAAFRSRHLDESRDDFRKRKRAKKSSD